MPFLPSFLCCTRSTSPKSPSGAPSVRPPPFLTERVDAGADSPQDDPSESHDEASKLGYKALSLFTETLLPGQLPETPRDVALGPDTQVPKAGALLLEGRVQRDGRRQSGSLGAASQPQPIAEHQQATPSAESTISAPAALADLHVLRVPSRMRSVSPSFDADFRDGELVTSAAGASSGSVPGVSPSVQALLAAHHATHTDQHEDCDSGGDAGMLLEPPWRYAVSHSSGRRVLYRHYRPPSPGPPKNSSRAEDQATHAAASADNDGGAFPKGGGTASGRTAALRPFALLAWQRLQRELDAAKEVPSCPALLLPSRIYVHQQGAHVVYDGYGVELLSYLLKRQRLPEACCRSVMLQLLQALAALHADRWVHRNVSAETIWVEEERLEQEPSRQAPGEAQTTTPLDGTSLSLSPVAGAAAAAGAGGEGGMAAAAAVPPLPECPPGRSREFPPLRSDGTLRRREPPLPWLRARLGGLAWATRLAIEPSSVGSGGGGGSGSREIPLRELLGCAYHLAPEAISGAGYGRPADIWAAGVLLIMMLTGRPPFPGHNELEVMTRVLLAASESGEGSGSTESGAQEGAGPGQLALHDANPSAQRPRPGLAAGAGAGGGTAPAVRFGGFGYSVRHRAGSGVGADDPASSPRSQPPGQRPGALQQLVVQAVLESGASAECREALAGMLVADPARRLSADELLRLPWFAAAAAHAGEGQGPGGGEREADGG